MTPEKIVWTRSLNEIDRIQFLTPKSTRSGVFQPIQFGDASSRFTIACAGITVYPDMTNVGFGRVLTGDAVGAGFRAWLNERSGDRPIICQKRAEEEWTDVLARVFGRERIATLDSEKGLKTALPSHSILMRKPCESNVSFFDSLVRLFQSMHGSVQGWTCGGQTAQGASLLKLLFYHKDNVPEISQEWHFEGVCPGPLLHHRYVFKHESVFGESDVLSQVFGGSNQKPSIAEPQVYAHDGLHLKFNRLEIEVEPPRQRVRATLELVPVCECPAVSVYSQKLLGWFKRWDTTERWIVYLPSPFDKELSVVPRLCFPEGRGCYVPPQDGDSVLVSLCHGGDPVAEYNAVRPDAIETLECHSAVMIGDSLAVRANQQAVLAGGDSEQVVVDDTSVRIADKLVATKEEVKVQQTFFVGR